MRAGRARTVLASTTVLIVLAGTVAGCSSGGNTTATSADPCEQIADEAVAAWKAFQQKNGNDLQNLSDQAKSDLQALSEKVQTLQQDVKTNGCNEDEVGRRIQDQAPDFMNVNSQGSRP
ncbi:MAG: hypothetical protein U0U69_03565 [Acidimicrobiia bacterium]